MAQMAERLIMTERLIVCAGLPRSGSTWAFNAVIKLMGAVDPAEGVYSDTVDDGLFKLLVSGKRVVLKTHRPDAAVMALAEACGSPVIITIRDPRDCIASLMQQFGLGFAEALEQVSESARAIMDMSACSQVLFIKYEAKSARSRSTLKVLAEKLSAAAAPNDIADIHKELSPKAVKEFIAHRVADGQFNDQIKAVAQWDPVTHWHPNHIGDGKAKKYLELLTPDQQALAFYNTKSFCERFGYEADSQQPISEGETISFGGTGAAFLEKGFGPVEPWGVWLTEKAGRLTIPLAADHRRIQIELGAILGPVFRYGTPGVAMTVSINGLRSMSIASGIEETDIILALSATLNEPGRAIVDFSLAALMSPSRAGINADIRELGLGLKWIQIHHLD